MLGFADIIGTVTGDTSAPSNWVSRLQSDTKLNMAMAGASHGGVQIAIKALRWHDQ